MHSKTHASGFVELLARSSFSFLKGASQPEELLREAKAKKLQGLGLCDLNGIYGSVRGWKASGNVSQRRLNQAQSPGSNKGKFQFIVGAELSLTNELQARWPDAEASPMVANSQEGRALTLALLVENTQGYESLCRLLTLSHAGRPKGQCACDPFFLQQHHLGLSALVITPHDPNQLAPEIELKSIFELLKHYFVDRLNIATYRYLDGLDRTRTRWAQKWSSAFKVPIVATARPLYHAAKRRNLADVLYCIRHGKTLDEAGQGLSPNREAFLRSESEMLKLFADQPQWVHASTTIAARMQFDFSQLHYHFPCKLAQEQSADQRLEQLTWEGVGRRYPGGISQQLRTQLSKELNLIRKLKLAPYFLSTYDIVEIAREKKILCQGRGSAANSAVCYVLGITAVDPSRSHLLFERFLSEERNEPPDIDVDFEHERREEVIQAIYSQYGRSHAAMVCEIVRFRRKSALREVGKAFGFSQEQLSRMSDSFSWHDKSEEQEKRLQEQGFDLKDPRLAQVYTIAEELIGFPRHLSIHVGGFVLSSRPLYEVAPIEPARMAGRTVIPWDKDDIDALGFFKVDVLALGMLSAIRKSLALVHQDGGLQEGFRHGSGTSSLADTSEPCFDPLEVITRIPAEDEATYDMICRADTVGVFQIESRAQMAMLPRLRPRRFYDLVIEVAIVRPGPIQGGMVHTYLRRRNQEERITCPHVDLWPILKRTLGVPLFQ